MDPKKIIDRTIAAYRKAHLISEGSQVASTWHMRKEYGYPVPYVERDRDVHTADPQLRALGIFSRGRFGGWKYEVGNQDHVCMQGVEAVDQMVLGLRELELFEPNLINGMYRPYPPHNLVPAKFQKTPVIDIVIARCHQVSFASLPLISFLLSLLPALCLPPPAFPCALALFSLPFAHTCTLSPGYVQPLRSTPTGDGPWKRLVIWSDLTLPLWGSMVFVAWYWGRGRGTKT